MTDKEAMQMALDAELVEAITNFIKVKGRHNTEIAYQRLVKSYEAAFAKAQGGNNDVSLL